MKPLDQLFWIRVALGLAAGFGSGLLGFLGPSEQVVNGILLAIGIYLASYYFARYGIRLSVQPQEKSKLATAGLGSYIMLFLFSWILYNTYLVTGL